MKKSLSILLSFALVFGLFASMASAADTELTVAQKYQALVDKGVLKGNPDGDARLDNNLNRAEFATIAIAISGLAEEKPATATFSDVNSKQWWYGAIEAAAKAGLVEGYNGKFNPRNNVTVEEVIKVAVVAADLTAVEGAEVEGASAWAGPYVQAALDAGLIASGLDYKADATRGQTILVGYAVYEKLNPTEPAKASVVSAKAAGVAKVEVVLDKAVDTEKAKLTLKRGTATVATDTKWADDKKSATLTLKDTKINEADYSVTLSGLAADEIATATASFKGEKEDVKKIEFVTSSEEIVKSTRAKVKLRAENQYGELASFGPTSYTANAIGYEKSLQKDDEGYLILTIDTSSSNLISGVGILPVYVYFNDTRLTAQKSFKVSTQAFVTNLELGTLKYNNGKEALSKAGETAEVPVKLFDQFGNPVTADQVTSDAAQGINIAVNINAVVSPYVPALGTPTNNAATAVDEDYKVIVAVQANEVVEKASSHTLTIYAGGTSKSTTVELSSSRVATGVKVGDVDGVIADGDNNIIIPLIVTDANNDELNAQEIVDNKARINVTSSGGFAANASIIEFGKDKGKVLVASATGAKSFGFLSASITTVNANSYDYKQFKIDDARIPQSIAVVEQKHTKAVRGAESGFKFKVKDQYGKDLNYGGNDYYVTVAVSNTNGPASGNTVNAAVYGDDGQYSTSGNLTYNNAGAATITAFNNGFKFDTNDGDIGTTRALATLWKAGGTPAEISRASVTIESIKNDTPLFYSLGDVSELYAAKTGEEDNYLTTVQATLNNVASVQDRTIDLVVKDAAGNSVAYDDNFEDITVSNASVLNSAVATKKASVIGVKAGAATVTAVVRAADGTTKSLSKAITVKNDVIVVKSVVAKDKEEGTMGQPLGTAATIADLSVLMNLHVKDQYGSEYATTDIAAHDKVTGIRYTVSNIKGTGDVVVSKSGNAYQAAVDANVTEFVLTAVSPDGEQSASIIVKR